MKFNKKGKKYYVVTMMNGEFDAIWSHGCISKDRMDAFKQHPLQMLLNCGKTSKKDLERIQEEGLVGDEDNGFIKLAVSYICDVDPNQEFGYFPVLYSSDQKSEDHRVHTRSVIYPFGKITSIGLWNNGLRDMATINHNSSLLVNIMPLQVPEQPVPSLSNPFIQLHFINRNMPQMQPCPDFVLCNDCKGSNKRIIPYTVSEKSDEHPKKQFFFGVMKNKELNMYLIHGGFYYSHTDCLNDHPVARHCDSRFLMNEHGFVLPKSIKKEFNVSIVGVYPYTVKNCEVLKNLDCKLFTGIFPGIIVESFPNFDNGLKPLLRTAFSYNEHTFYSDMGEDKKVPLVRLGHRKSIKAYNGNLDDIQKEPSIVPSPSPFWGNWMDDTEEEEEEEDFTNDSDSNHLDPEFDKEIDELLDQLCAKHEKWNRSCEKMNKGGKR